VLRVAVPFKLFIFYLEEFFVNGFFSYDFELIIVSCVLIFSIFFNYSFNKLFYDNLNIAIKINFFILFVQILKCFFIFSILDTFVTFIITKFDYLMFKLNNLFKRKESIPKPKISDPTISPNPYKIERGPVILLNSTKGEQACQEEINGHLYTWKYETLLEFYTKCVKNLYFGSDYYENFSHKRFLDKGVVDSLLHFGVETDFTFSDIPKKDLKYLMREILTSKKLMVIYLKTGEGKNLSPEKKSELNLHIYFLDTMVSAIGKKLDAGENAAFHNNPEVEKANMPEKQSLQAETIFYSSVSYSDVDLHPYSDFYAYVN